MATTFTTPAEIVANAFSNDWALSVRKNAKVDMGRAGIAMADWYGVNVAQLVDEKSPEGYYDWEFIAESLLAKGLDTAEAINGYGDEVAERLWNAAKEREAARELAESQYDYHVQAYGARGEYLMDTGFCADMGMYASMRTEAEADAWATNAFTTDARVHSVGVTIHRRSSRTVSWVFHSSVKTIERPTV